MASLDLKDDLYLQGLTYDQGVTKLVDTLVLLDQAEFVEQLKKL